MRLFLDRGNSSVKWAARDDAAGTAGEWVAEGRLLLDADGHVTDADLAALPAADEWWLASVARDERDAALVAQLENNRNMIIKRIVTEASAAGVTCAYAEPSRLGVDRWLAVIAAYEPQRPAIVIDAGTAITIDAVDGSGIHLGGLIAPGIGLMRHSLYTNTDRIPDEGESATELLGSDTRAAVSGGTLHAAAGFIDRVAGKLLATDPDMRCLLTGGDAERLNAVLETSTEYRPRLVLDGMRRVADARTSDRRAG